MNKIQIGQTDIFLENFEKFGQGKITIADTWNGAYTYTWGAMNGTIEDFILRINSGYFASKLCRNTYVFSGKASARNIRKHIKTDFNYEIPWYKYMDAQKELREAIKELESCQSENEFVNACYRLPSKIMCYGLGYNEEKEFLEVVTSIFTQEPWHFISTTTSPEYNFLTKLHSKLKKELKKHD